ncbi:MAG TPA: hypothetical protein VK106_01620, partial [Balneolaceae bacterium]|nr:hypothetical protein [Balneolaceae bacterium]
LDFKIKRIVSQRRGYITVRFNTEAQKSKKITVSVSGETIARLSQFKTVPIKYNEGGYIEAVFLPTYDVQTSFILSNMAMAAVAFILTFFVGIWAHRKAARLSKSGEKELVFERVG